MVFNVGSRYSTLKTNEKGREKKIEINRMHEQMELSNILSGFPIQFYELKQSETKGQVRIITL